jgi:hypothetical protein
MLGYKMAGKWLLHYVCRTTDCPRACQERLCKDVLLDGLYKGSCTKQNKKILKEAVQSVSRWNVTV